MAEGKIPEEDIYEALRSLNVPVQKNDLKSPTREFIVRVFEYFLKDLQIDITSPELRTWQALSHFEETDIYEDAQLLIILAMCMNYIFKGLSLNITIKDIVEPKPKRTKKILNFILVFWTYYLQKYSKFRAIEESFESVRKEAENLVIQNQGLDEKYNEMVNAIKNMPSKAELNNAVEATKKKKAKLEKQNAELQADYKATKTKIADIENQIVSTDVSIVTARERIEELDQLIISSPERINSEIQRLKDRIKHEELRTKEKEAELKETEKKLQIQEQNLKVYENSQSTLNSIFENLRDLKNSVKSIVLDQEKIEAVEDKKRKLEKEVHQKEEWKVHHEEKSLKVVLNTKMRKENLITALEALKREEKKEKKVFKNTEAVMQELEDQIEFESNSIIKIIEDSKEANAKSKERTAQYMSRLKENENSFTSDCDELIQVINEKFQGIPE